MNLGDVTGWLGAILLGLAAAAVFVLALFLILTPYPL